MQGKLLRPTPHCPSPKVSLQLLSIYLRQILTDIHNSFTFTLCGKFAILNITPRLNCVATLRCEIHISTECVGESIVKIGQYLTKIYGQKLEAYFFGPPYMRDISYLYIIKQTEAINFTDRWAHLGRLATTRNIVPTDRRILLERHCTRTCPSTLWQEFLRSIPNHIWSEAGLYPCASALLCCYRLDHGPHVP